MAYRPARLTTQIASLASYLRTARANYNRAYREVSATYGTRRTRPFEQHLRSRCFDEAWRLLKLAELCLRELCHQRAITLAPFRPGDQILVSVTMKGYERAPQRYLIMDVEWQKGDLYHYIVREITKGGWLHRGRYEHWVTPSNRIAIEACAEPLDAETTRTAARVRANAKARRADALERGSLELFDEELKRSRW